MGCSSAGADVGLGWALTETSRSAANLKEFSLGLRNLAQWLEVWVCMYVCFPSFPCILYLQTVIRACSYLETLLWRGCEELLQLHSCLSLPIHMINHLVSPSLASQP